MNYRKIYVGVDGSELATAATRYAIEIGKAYGAELFGSHVYAAKLHDRRFKMMEGGLPEEFREEAVLEDQRNVHDSLITQGLELITDSYLQSMQAECDASNVAFSAISLEGKNWQELASDINGDDYDLVMLGAHGVGRVAVSQLGTVTERVLRRVNCDVFICKTPPDANVSNDIVVCLDGSSRSWGALRRAMGLAKSFGKRLVAISSFDPYFHYAMFGAINKVLTDQAREVFKFEEQEKLHEDIIDSGLAKIYQSHLDIAKRIASDEGCEVETHLLDGKAYAKILEFAGERSPWLLVMGRIGIHSDKDMDIGGNTENVCRLINCNVLVVDMEYTPPSEFVADATMRWTKEALEKMKMVPPMARGVAMKAVQNQCVATGHTVVTTSVLNEAIRNLLPPEMIERMGIRFDDEEDVGTDGGEVLSLSFECKSCGHICRGARPQECPVCGDKGKVFKLIEKENIKNGVSVPALGDRKLVWEKRCLEALEAVDDPVLRLEIRNKVEKQALTRRVDTVTYELFEECAGNAIDAGGGELVWTDAAVERMERVPEGFMRNTARGSVEDYARAHGIGEITLEVANAGLEKARESMTTALKGGHPHAARVGGAAKSQGHQTGSFECTMCGYVVDGERPGACPSCTADDLREMSSAERAQAPETATKLVAWDDEALAKLERVPDGFMRVMTRGRVEQWARQRGQERITADVVVAKYDSWQKGSSEVALELEWAPDALARADKIPEFIRPMVLREVERAARAHGHERVTGDVIERAMRDWLRRGSFHGK